MVAVFYAILSGFSVWVWLTGGPREDGKRKEDLTRDDKIQRAKNALTAGTAFIWIFFGGVFGIWLFYCFYLWAIGVISHLLHLTS